MDTHLPSYFLKYVVIWQGPESKAIEFKRKTSIGFIVWDLGECTQAIPMGLFPLKAPSGQSHGGKAEMELTQAGIHRGHLNKTCSPNLVKLSGTFPAFPFPSLLIPKI